ncbi:MAG: 30S ribosome-binding factor RbfA [Malacoplasma sp.]|nr:30S ribosome-binding factor RbfA [Malacoplasma sp.]
MGNDIKLKRYESLIADLISNAITKEIYDPLIQLATVHYVTLTKDKSIAKVYISCYDKTMINKILKKINGAAGFFRTILAKNLDLRKAPAVVFFNDETIDRFDEIDALLDQIRGSE